MTDELEAMWARHQAEWRDPAQVASQWQAAAATDPKLLRHRTRGPWWEILQQCGVVLLVTREYEHLIMALQASTGEPQVSYWPLPHPSGIAVDGDRGLVHIASTRNPNQVYDFVPATGLLARQDVPLEPRGDRPLVPLRSRFFPGCLYMHDLALIGGALHANAVGHNAIARLHDDGRFERVWHPRCIERDGEPVFGLNYLQLNSIAAGPDLASSYFSASTDQLSARRPGHRNFPVDGRGVLFSGRTREVAARGLTRPHSARWYRQQIWVDNSGYGELCVMQGERCEAIAQLPGWTRGLCFVGDLAFVATSRVIPRFRQYAPGLDVDHSECGLHAVDPRSGQILASLVWPYGNQIFAIEALSPALATGFPFRVGRARPRAQEKQFFYAFKTPLTEELR